MNALQLPVSGPGIHLHRYLSHFSNLKSNIAVFYKTNYERATIHDSLSILDGNRILM